MFKNFKILLFSGIMMLALTAQPHGKNGDSRNKSSVVALEQLNVADQPVYCDVQAIENFVAPVSQDFQHAVYITTSEVSEGNCVTNTKPDKPERWRYQAKTTNEDVAAIKWKDFHRRLRTI